MASATYEDAAHFLHTLRSALRKVEGASAERKQ
jgi:hypothetical protein